MDVNGMRQAKVHRGLRQLGDDLAGGDAKVMNRSIEVGNVAEAALPLFDAAGIDEFDGVSFGRVEQPADESAELFRLFIGDLA
jgi:hypothetical protein